MGGGGKADGRQMMINMMYLVLTALLAMNVSKEVLVGFQVIADSLEMSANEVNTRNDKLAKEIEAAVRKELEKGVKKNEALPKMAKDVQDESKKILEFIDGLVNKLRSPEIAGLDPETKKMENKSETEKNYQFWMKENGLDTDNDGRGAGKAKELKDKIEAYFVWANKKWEEITTVRDIQTGKVTTPGEKNRFKNTITIDPKDDPSVPMGDNKNKRWEYYYFHEMPAVSNEALMRKIKLEITHVEYELLEAIKKKFGEIPFLFDKPNLLVAPANTRVVAGLPFKAKVFVVMTSKNMKPVFSSTGGGTLKQPDGKDPFATYETRANGDLADKVTKEGKQTYSFSARILKTDGTYETVTEKGEFTVVLPTADFSGKGLNRLYKACKNTIIAKVPALGSDYNPKFALGNGEGELVQSTASKEEVYVIPRGKKCKFSIYQKGTDGAQDLFVGDKEYDVIDPPKPIVRLTYDGKEWNGIDKIPQTAKLRFEVVPDKDFDNPAFEEDCIYRTGKIVLEVETPTGPVALGSPLPAISKEEAKKMKKSGAKTFFKEVKLSSILPENFKPGSRLQISIDGVYRVNFKNEDVREEIPKSQLVILPIVK